MLPVIASRICPSYYLNDAGYMYMEGVKVHEFYHNINVRPACSSCGDPFPLGPSHPHAYTSQGSQVTGMSPFQIWLNEAVTVHVQVCARVCLCVLCVPHMHSLCARRLDRRLDRRPSASASTSCSATISAACTRCCWPSAPVPALWRRTSLPWPCPLSPSASTAPRSSSRR